VKSAEEIMEILEAYDLTGSLRDAAELAGCSHHTVAQYVAARERGELTPGRAQRRVMLADPFLDKLEEWVERSRGKVRADVAHEKLIALVTRAQNAPPGERSPRSRQRIGPGAGGCIGHGCRSRGCGFSTTSATVRASMVLVHSCFARGWRGAGLGWCWRCWIRRRRR